MRKWRVTPIGAAFVALVLLVLLFVLRGALHHPTRVVLPQEKSSTEDDGLSLDDNSAGRVTVRPDTVQSAVATLARPACYTRSITIERYYTGGSGVDRSTVSVDGAWMRTDTEEASGELSHTVTNGEKTWLWYGSGKDYFESAASFTADEEQGIPTYEDILRLDEKRIASADYRLLDTVDCIYVETAADALGYVERYWVSVSDGLLCAAEKLNGDEVVYRMAGMTVDTAAVSADTFSTELATGEAQVIDSGNRLVDSAVNGILPAAGVGASANPVQIWLSVGAAVWVIGMMALTVLSLIKYFRLTLIMDGSERDGNIAVSESFGTAFVLGLFRPVICLPAGLSEGDRRVIVAHETAHIRRGDHIVKMVSYILLIIHWYDPVMWLAFGLMTRDMEMSCDEAVVNGGCDRSEYAGALLRLSVGNEILPAIPPTFGEGAVKERIVNVMRFNVSNVFVNIGAVIADCHRLRRYRREVRWDNCRFCGD